MTDKIKSSIYTLSYHFGLGSFTTIINQHAIPFLLAVCSGSLSYSSTMHNVLHKIELQQSLSAELENDNLGSGGEYDVSFI